MYFGESVYEPPFGGYWGPPKHGRNLHELYVKAQQVVDHCRENDIRGYAYYNEVLHRAKAAI